MLKYLWKSAILICFTVVICCGIYPGVVWIIGQTVFPFQANGSMVDVKGEKLNYPDAAEASGQLAGSLLIGQPFTKDEYFQPRPSAISTPYDASAGTSSALAASNYALRARVASTLGPIVTYRSGPKAGQLVAPDIEAWFQQDKFQGSPSIVAQWADLHNTLAQGWVLASGSTYDPKNPTPQQQYVLDWAKSHPAVVAKFKSDNPTITDPQPADLAIVFFETFSKEHPGMFPSAITPPATTQPAAAAAAPTTQPVAAAAAPTTQPSAAASGAPAPATQPTAAAPTTQPVAAAPTTIIGPVNSGSDIQTNFFDMWRQDHPDADLQDVPADMVTTSASGLDPHITLQNAQFQLDRVAGKWATDLKRDPKAVHDEIQQLLDSSSAAPLGGLAGEKIVNVLEVNLALRKLYGAPPS